MIHKIEFIVRYNGVENNVELSTVNGGPSGWHVLINKYYNGTVVKLKDVWVGHMNERCKLTDEQIQAIGKRIDAYEQKSGL